VHDRTVAEDYYAAMDIVEKRLEVIPPEKEEHAESQVNDDERTHLLDLAKRLTEPELSVTTRLALVDRMGQVLNHGTTLECTGSAGNGQSPLPNKTLERAWFRHPEPYLIAQLWSPWLC